MIKFSEIIKCIHCNKKLFSDTTLHQLVCRHCFEFNKPNAANVISACRIRNIDYYDVYLFFKELKMGLTFAEPISDNYKCGITCFKLELKDNKILEGKPYFIDYPIYELDFSNRSKLLRKLKTIINLS